MLFMINNNIADKQRKNNNTIYLNPVAQSLVLVKEQSKSSVIKEQHNESGFTFMGKHWSNHITCFRKLLHLIRLFGQISL